MARRKTGDGLYATKYPHSCAGVWTMLLLPEPLQVGWRWEVVIERKPWEWPFGSCRL